jgi:hypothetical protein
MLIVLYFLNHIRIVDHRDLMFVLHPTFLYKSYNLAILSVSIILK